MAVIFWAGLDLCDNDVKADKLCAILQLFSSAGKALSN
jgi:hypothetical protein